MGFDWWVADLWQQSPVLLVSWIVWVIGSIVLHELAHGWTAIRCGDDTPIHTGHMTWNPLVHMGQVSLIMFALVGIAWGLMPVNPSNFRGRYDNAKVALAGPMMNLFLALAAAALYVVVRGFGGGAWVAGVALSEPLYSNLSAFFTLGVMLNIVLFVLNMAPIPPLDGWRILSNFSPAYERIWSQENAQMIALFAFMALFWFGAPYVWDLGYAVTGRVLLWGVQTLAPGSAIPQGI